MKRFALCALALAIVASFATPAKAQMDQGHLVGTVTDAQNGGSGLGTGLIERGEEELRARGFTAALLNVLADNPRARRFYERQGWVRGETFQSTFLGHEVELARHRKELSETAGV